MAFVSLDDLISEIAAGKFQRLVATRLANTGATSVASRWHEAFTVANGTGGIGVLSGSAGVGAAMNAATPGALPLSPVSVSPDTRHLLSMSAVTPTATLVPGSVRLVDLLYVYPSCVLTGTPTTLNNGAAKPARFNNGAGVQAMAAVVTTGVGAAQPVLTMTYKDQDNNDGTGYFAASANSQPIGSLLTGAAIAGVLGGPNMLLGAGDSGVRQLTSYAIASGTTGLVSFVLYRDICEVPLVALNVAGERDFLSQMPSLPKIDDDACLAMLFQPGGAMVTNATVLATLQMAWG